MTSDIPRKTGKWLRNDVPHTGWSCTGIEDGGSICQMCEVTRIAYRHIMVHDKYPLPLECGCVCAGFMTEDPRTEHLRELLYRWRKLQADTPIEKLRRKGWRRGSHKMGHVFGWSFRGTKHSPIDNFDVEISDTDGWRFHVYHPWHTEIMRSEPFESDALAATAGIAWAETLMANEQWVASECEAQAERIAALRANELAANIRYTAKRARELNREDIAAAVEARTLAPGNAWNALRAEAWKREAEATP
jgi:hypothetical protein